jgi:hypothetical protein
MLTGVVKALAGNSASLAIVVAAEFIRGRRERARLYAGVGAASSTRRGMSTSRAMTSRWICDVPS